MKTSIFILLLFVTLACITESRAMNNGSAQAAQNDENQKPRKEDEMETNQFYIHVNGHTLTMDLIDNSSVRAIAEELKTGDMTIRMKDYANFEKFGELPRSFPRNDERITTEAGDVILSEGKLLVIYYDRNSWNFTRLGKIRNISQSELKKILGAGNPTVTVSLTSTK